MIVFREQRRRTTTTALLEEARSAAARLAAVHRPAHDAVVDALIVLGVLETAVVDRLFAEADGIDPLADTLREASLAAGHLLWHSWYETWEAAAPWLDRLHRRLGALAAASLPREVESAVPEGFAHYAVYPESYLEAVRRHAAELRGRAVVCLGLRSIGTALAAAVGAACEELGCSVTSFTIRPRGHPFDRRPKLTGALRDAIGRAALGRTAKDTRGRAAVLVVDEGPGLSGSSFAGTAETLNELGVADDDILFFPSWSTDGQSLLAASARQRWPRHRRCVVDFETIWPLPSSRNRHDLGDWSAGAWRADLYADNMAYPAVHPQHERRKYRMADPPRLYRFAGLGRLGDAKWRRAQELAAAGWCPEPVRLDRGFLESRFAEGTPLDASAVVAEASLLDTLAAYLAHRSGTVAEPTVTDDAMAAMIRVNVTEALGGAWAAKLGDRLPGRWSAALERPVALDGRMLPHEWLRTATGYLKTDGIDHHDDHFFPGCQDIAWDVAATCTEFALPPAARRYLVDRYRTASGDRTIRQRLAAHTIAYLAFRVGYVHLAATTLGASDDGRRFAALAPWYTAQLREALTCDSTASV